MTRSGSIQKRELELVMELLRSAASRAAAGDVHRSPSGAMGMLTFSSALSWEDGPPC